MKGIVNDVEVKRMNLRMPTGIPGYDYRNMHNGTSYTSGKRGMYLNGDREYLEQG